MTEANKYKVTSMHLVNHVRGDGLQILAVFDAAGERGVLAQCQLVADPGAQKLWALHPRRGKGYALLVDAICERASAAYDDLMSDWFGVDWREINDGRARTLEWVL